MELEKLKSFIKFIIEKTISRAIIWQKLEETSYEIKDSEFIEGEFNLHGSFDTNKGYKINLLCARILYPPITSLVFEIDLNDFESSEYRELEKVFEELHKVIEVNVTETKNKNNEESIELLMQSEWTKEPFFRR